MYRALWNVIPGPLWLRISISVVAAAAVVALLGFVVYPWIATVLSAPTESTVQ